MIDRCNLLVWPVLLGSGKSLFGSPDGDKQMLNLRKSEACGIVKLV